MTATIIEFTYTMGITFYTASAVQTAAHALELLLWWVFTTLALMHIHGSSARRACSAACLSCSLAVAC